MGQHEPDFFISDLRRERIFQGLQSLYMIETSTGTRRLNHCLPVAIDPRRVEVDLAAFHESSD